MPSSKNLGIPQRERPTQILYVVVDIEKNIPEHKTTGEPEPNFSSSRNKLASHTKELSSYRLYGLLPPLLIHSFYLKQTKDRHGEKKNRKTNLIG